MSNKLMVQVWAESRQSHAKLLIMLGLADQANDDGVCWPAYKSIAMRARIHFRTARRYIDEMCAEDRPEISKRPRFTDTGRKTSNYYQINCENLGSAPGGAVGSAPGGAVGSAPGDPLNPKKNPKKEESEVFQTSSQAENILAADNAQQTSPASHKFEAVKEQPAPALDITNKGRPTVFSIGFQVGEFGVRAEEVTALRAGDGSAAKKVKAAVVSLKDFLRQESNGLGFEFCGGHPDLTLSILEMGSTREDIKSVMFDAAKSIKDGKMWINSIEQKLAIQKKSTKKPTLAAPIDWYVFTAPSGATRWRKHDSDEVREYVEGLHPTQCPEVE